MAVKQLEINFYEAQIIEMSFKGRDEDISNFRRFLIQIGECLVTGKSRIIGVEAEDLWLLRDKISPAIKVGPVSGLDLLKKVYALLLEYEEGKLKEQARVVPLPEQKQIMRVEGRDSEDFRKGKDRTKDEAGIADTSNIT